MVLVFRVAITWHTVKLALVLRLLRSLICCPMSFSQLLDYGGSPIAIPLSFLRRGAGKQGGIYCQLVTDGRSETTHKTSSQTVSWLLYKADLIVLVIRNFQLIARMTWTCSYSKNISKHIYTSVHLG